MTRQTDIFASPAPLASHQTFHGSPAPQRTQPAYARFQTHIFHWRQYRQPDPTGSGCIGAKRRMKNTDVQIHHIGDYYERNDQYDCLKAQGETNFIIGGHARLRDTSELLHNLTDGIRPEIIRSKGGLHLSITGASGDAPRATAKIGRTIDRANGRGGASTNSET